MSDLLNKEIEKICKKNKLMGANVLLFDSEQIVYSYNYGYANKGQRMKSTNDSLYMIGSNTKVMTAVCILKLMEDGVLSLDDDIKELKNTYLTAVPGTMFAYSNVGYTMLGIIIERASGYTYQEYIERIIAQPLGIDIRFLQTKEERELFSKDISLCYNRKGKAVEDPLCTMLPAGSNTYISIADFVKFGQIFLKKDGTILKKETLELMETLKCPEEIDKELCNGGYGLLHNRYNFGENVGKIYGHGGDTMYHHSVFYYIPDQNIGIAVFTNSEQAVNAAGHMANKAVISYLSAKGIRTEKNSYTYNYVPGECDKYLGKYATPFGVCDVRKSGKGELSTKVKGLSVNLKLCKDGFWHLCPNHLLLSLPPIKKETAKIRIKFA